MKNFKNFYSNFIKGTLCKRPLQDAKNYFYDFFQKNIIEESEIARLTELKKFITDFDELRLIDNKLENLKTTCLRNSHIVKETEEQVKKLEEHKQYHEYIYQAIWLKNVFKYYPSQEQYILKDYGVFVMGLIKDLNSKDENEIVYYIDRLISFIEEYKFAIRLAVNALGNLKCKLINELKINHSIQMGFEAYLIGGIKNDGVVAALLSDAMQYSTNAEKFQEKIKKITEDFNGMKVLDIYTKTGQNPIMQQEPWDVRKAHQLKILNTPGISSFSGSVVLLIGKKINLYEISKFFEESENLYKKLNPNATDEMVNAYMQDKKHKFWYDYASISEEEAKDYYSKLAYTLSRIQSIPEFLFEEYEDYYLKIFGDYPIF